MGRPASGTRDAAKGLSDGADTDEEEKLVGWLRKFTQEKALLELEVG